MGAFDHDVVRSSFGLEQTEAANGANDVCFADAETFGLSGAMLSGDQGKPVVVNHPVPLAQLVVQQT